LAVSNAEALAIFDHDLLPIPYTNEALGLVVDRVQLVQDYLGRQIVLGNLSTYARFNDSEMPK
jgi:uncharacterized protein (UPF0276 family)